MNKINLNFLSIVGYAGQGKDTVKNFIIKNFKDVDFHNIIFAEVMKQQLYEILPENIIKMTGEKKSDKIIDKLKNDFTDTIIFKNYNTRELLQKLGTEFYRDLDPDIHIRFSALKILDRLLNNKNLNYMFISSDTRFPNELDFMLKISQIKNKEKEIDFINYYLSNSKNLPNKNDFVNHFEKVFNIEVDKCNFSRCLIDRMYKDIEKLNKKFSYKKDWSELNVPITKGMSVKESIKNGVFHVFRPILPINKKIDLSTISLKEEIKNYTNLKEDEILKIYNCYKKYNIDFNMENINKYGFMRADVNHYSESAINNRKPMPFISEPCKNAEEIYLLERKIVNQFTVKNNKIRCRMN